MKIAQKVRCYPPKVITQHQHWWISAVRDTFQNMVIYFQQNFLQGVRRCWGVASLRCSCLRIIVKSSVTKVNVTINHQKKSWQMHSSGVTYAFTGNLTLSSFCKLIMSILFCCCLSCAKLIIIERKWDCVVSVEKHGRATLEFQTWINAMYTGLEAPTQKNGSNLLNTDMLPWTSISDVLRVKYIDLVDPFINEFKKRNEESGEDESGRRMTKHFCCCCTFDPDSPS